ncbi:porin [Mucilaginibacter sp. ZT4R22]|uniref:Porin n=1 Tax=Mucilaginibacter pankratovii TaxID=2772110 RepID=A0ABR7WK68_9SPHI|nr:porin [Mucilaginibacter pankratovii]MBD1362712.1 porin [Mucilaginibacter pankratovii]
MKNNLRYLLGVMLLCPCTAMAQNAPKARSGTDTITNFSTYKRSITFAGLLQTRFLGSLTKNVDVNGKNFDPAATTGKITNTFLLKRVRFLVKGTVNDHFSANLLMNFAEFSSDPSNKVLENAFVKYTLSSHFNVQAGQFRPFFGIEDVVPNDIIRTLDYSNQYYAFGASGWQSFQTGVAVFGNINKGGQLRYYAGAYNGNNRNQANDNDNTKNFYGRLEADVVKGLTFGFNASAGSLGAGNGNALGIDIKGGLALNEKWELSLGGEYKTGTNFALYNALTVKPALSQVRMQGFYIFPIIRYNANMRRVRAIEFSSRYEYFNENYWFNHNSRQTIIPNASLIFADDFYAALQLGVSIDIYQKNIPLTTAYNHNLAYLQLQVRF